MSLIDAINKESYELADQLITKRQGLYKTDMFCCTPLMLLLCNLKKPKVCLELITKLIDAGADVNIKENVVGLHCIMQLAITIQFIQFI